MTFILCYVFFLICIQIVNDTDNSMPIIANVFLYIGNIFILVLLVWIIKYFHHGVNFLGFGMLSAFIYCIILVYLLAAAPKNDNTMPK